MRRPTLLVVAVLLIGGCRKAAETEPLGSPADSVASTEARQDDRLGAPAQHPDVAKRAGLASSLIAVATTNASEAQPCERVCGSLGDCLLADADYTTAAAGGLELVCLDMCVHSVDGAPAKAEFLACGGQNECGQLQACAERSWTALAAARQGPEVAGVTAASGDSCKLSCEWMYACMYTNAPPGAATLEPTIQMASESCVASCELRPEADREYYDRLAPCFVNHCSVDGVYQCFEEAGAYMGY